MELCGRERAAPVRNPDSGLDEKGGIISRNSQKNKSESRGILEVTTIGCDSHIPVEKV